MKKKTNNYRLWMKKLCCFLLAFAMIFSNVSIAKAEAVLRKMLLIIRCEFNLDIIHGYSHGIKIKAMLTEYKNERILKRRGYNENPGLTYMKIRAA